MCSFCFANQVDYISMFKLDLFLCSIHACAELPKNTKCLMDCEAAEILQGIQDRMVVLSADPAIKIPM